MEDSDQKPSKKTLLQKYEIPIEFLDFGYIKTCEDAKLLEKIVKILRSGEEGYYPDLTKFAVEKLKSIKPDSKVLRIEDSQPFLDHEKRAEIDDEMKAWIQEMKTTDKIAMETKPLAKPEPPIRTSKVSQENSPENASKEVERIKSTDYAKWDKFDADAAELKIDLDEERQREIVELKNKKNSEKVKLIEEIEDVEVDCLTDFEKDRLSLKFKEKGNECFKAKDYEEAIREYTQSLRVKKSAAAFNNRALIRELIAQY
jgi:sperm-associated antigen 1